MFGTVKMSFFLVEINLVLWLVALGTVLTSGVRNDTLWVAIAGFIFAAIWQHQAFYRRRRDREAARSTHESEAA